MSKVDLWIGRLSQIAQIGLFAVTVVTIYFTVIPLYQKAALEESIARANSELNALTTRTEELYFKNRKYALNEFTRDVWAQCNPMMPYAMQPAVPEDKPMTIIESLTKEDLPECIASSFKSSQLSTELHESDFRLVEINVTNLSQRVEKQHQIAISEVLALENLSQTTPESLDPPGELRQKLLRTLRPWMDDERYQKTETRERVAETANRIAIDFLTYFKQEISILRNMQWPNDSSAMP